MKIQILQGINLENDVTTIKILFDKEIDKGIIEEIKAYHPIFLKSYTLDKNQLTIQSKLPHMWEEIAKTLNQEKSYEKAKKRILEKIIRTQVKSMSTIAILDTADKMDEEITPFLRKEGLFTDFGDTKFNRQYCIGCGARSTVTVSLSSCRDSQLAKQLQTDKYLTNTLMERLSIPLAKWETIMSKRHLKEIFNKYKKPIVIKPTSLTGGKGVHTKINTIKEVEKAYNEVVYTINHETQAKQKNKIIIQEQIEGEDYRLLVVNNNLEAATKRVPAFVEGNGKSTIKELIEETNKDPRRDINNPTHILKPIKIDKPLNEYLKEQGLNLSYIPKNKEKITVRKVASMSQGGITVDFTDKVHKQIKYLSEILAQSLRAYVLGIDVICEDISKPLTPENGGIIEVNTMPEAYLNMHPVLGSQRPQIATKFLKGLLDSTPTKKIVILGGKAQEVKKITQSLKGNIGIYSKNSIYINNELINKDISADKAIESLKINAYLHNIVLHYNKIKEVKEYGLGFDKIDILYIKKDLSNQIRKLNTKIIKF